MRSDEVPDELARARPSAAEPDDLDAWWAKRLDEARALARPAALTPHERAAYGPVLVDDVEFSGHGGDRVRGWFVRPDTARDLPIVVTFLGYGGGRGVPLDHLGLAATGFAHLVMDTRGQGAGWSVGVTGDPDREPGPQAPGVMTRGITSAAHSYLTRLITDAVRAVETAAELSGVDASRLAVSGLSQGGGLALAAAALTPDLVRLCHSDIPFLCDFPRALELATEGPYREIVGYLAQHVDAVDAVLETLRYVDCALLASRVTATTLMSVGLVDEVCPPRTVLAAYNSLTAPKSFAVHRFSAHMLPPAHRERQLLHLRSVLGA